MKCSNSDCGQGRRCPNRLQACTANRSQMDFDPLPDLTGWDRITLWIALFICVACTLALAAGFMGFVYMKWIA